MSNELVYTVQQVCLPHTPAMSKPKPQLTLDQILLAPSDSDYLDLLVSTIKDATEQGREGLLMEELDRFAQEREAEIERMCNSNHQDFVQSVNQLLNARKGTVDLTTEILKLNKSIQVSTEKLVDNKKALVDSRGVRQNIDETTRALRMCLEVLGLANKVHDLLSSKKHYSALRTLDELQNVHLKEVTQYEIADMIRKSVPAMQRMVKDAVMQDLNDWLFHVREKSQQLGSAAFDETENRKGRMKARSNEQEYLRNFSINSAIELVLDERDESDPYRVVDIDFKPLFECLHIHNALGQRDEFRLEYAQVRRQQKDLLLPANIAFIEDDISSLARLLEDIAGFAIIERTTLKKTQNFRSLTDVEELWDSMLKKVTTLVQDATRNVSNAPTLLKVKKFMDLFIQTMDGYEYPVAPLNRFLFGMFSRYSDLLKMEFSKSVNETITMDDYMPMHTADPQEYGDIIEVAWYNPIPPLDLKTARYENYSLEMRTLTNTQCRFPQVLPFSQMYPMCCIEIRAYLNKFHFYFEENIQQQSEVEEILETSLDELLIDCIANPLVQKLNSQYLGQIVQIYVNLEHFENACVAIEHMLTRKRTVALPSPVRLKARESFGAQKKMAEKRIFELVNSKIDDLVETADYNWLAREKTTEPSAFLQEMTRFLNHIINSNLHALPQDIKGMVYFDALTHLASAIMSLPMQEEVKAITPAAVANLDLDVGYLEDFVGGLNMPSLPGIFDELRQTIELLQSNNFEEFFNMQTRMRRYASVDPRTGAILIEKYGFS